MSHLLQRCHTVSDIIFIVWYIIKCANTANERQKVYKQHNVLLHVVQHDNRANSQAMIAYDNECRYEQNLPIYS